MRPPRGGQNDRANRSSPIYVCDLQFAIFPPDLHTICTGHGGRARRFGKLVRANGKQRR